MLRLTKQLALIIIASYYCCHCILHSTAVNQANLGQLFPLKSSRTYHLFPRKISGISGMWFILELHK